MSTLTLEALENSQAQQDILERIVDAMLGAEDELREAQDEVAFSELLREACRSAKWQLGTERD